MKPPPAKLTISKEDYLKAIAEAASEEEVVIAATLARWLAISPPAVTAALRRLQRDGLVRLGPAGRLLLTAEGRAIADRIQARHYLVERMLAEMFGMPWYKVHDEAERLEHAVSPDFEERLRAVLGSGKPCPHGNDARVVSSAERIRRGHRRLSEISEPGGYVAVAANERDRKLLEFLDSLGLQPGTAFEWVSRNYDQTISLRIGGKSCSLGVPAAAGVWVAKDSPAKSSRKTR